MERTTEQFLQEAINHEVVTVNGNHYYLGDEKLAHGRANALQAMEERQEEITPLMSAASKRIHLDGVRKGAEEEEGENNPPADNEGEGKTPTNTDAEPPPGGGNGFPPLGKDETAISIKLSNAHGKKHPQYKQMRVKGVSIVISRAEQQTLVSTEVLATLKTNPWLAVKEV